ncbi:ArsR family transcriptional regulator [Rhodopirellula rubra]|uniref:ArsR family transcriptional regulator n=1 Tax=Aporhodopirellula rubra TaxID=980271 RepID=A0A7W5H4Q1_9BACT|nr:metalloregulator ArsR/SmtB family transcription factor [Aporhodopirellula rubra]MBB3205554.1 ArsR family transcriptional regulator [Aporhodopirellula rubra]
MKAPLDVLLDDSGEDPSCASVLKVLADNTRLAVVERLLNGPLTVTEINETLGVESTLLSHHLKALREAKLVTRTRQGRYSVYAVAPELVARRKGRSIDLGCCRISFS